MLWSFLVQPLSWSITDCHLKSTLIICHNPIETWFIVVAKIKRRWHFKMTIFSIFSELMSHPLIELFHLSNLIQMPNDRRMVDVEFLGTSSYSCKRISFDDALACHCQPLISFHDGSQSVIVNFWGQATTFLIFRALVSFAKLPEPPLHCTSVSSSWAKCVVDVASCLCCFMTHFELK